MEERKDEPDPLVPVGILTSSPIALVVLASPFPLDNHRQFQKLLWRVVEELQISLENVQDLQHKFLDILEPVGSSCVALPVNEAILELARSV